MEKISLQKATLKDQTLVVDIDYRLNQKEHVELKREQKISKAILDQTCYLILASQTAVGFILFDYRFFDQGWIELMVIGEEFRGKGIGPQAIDLICRQSQTDKVFTSTNSSNTPMQKALQKVGFSFAGQLIGLDEGDPELFYFKATSPKNTQQ